jgi:hypothetical protein
MTELVFKKEWDCITEDGNPNFKKFYKEHSTNYDDVHEHIDFEKRFKEQQREYYKVNKEYILERRKRFDKALYFEFNDNDFAKEIEDMMVHNFIPEINEVLNWCEPWTMESVIERKLDELFNADNLLVKMKYWFVTQSMLNDLIWRQQVKEYNTELLDKVYEHAKKDVEYIFRGPTLVTGTNEEINQAIKLSFEDCQFEEELERGVEEYWLGGDAFVLRIVDNKVVYHS